MTQYSIQQAFDLAIQHHQAGRLREAEQIYRQILAQQPEHADAIHFLGLLANQTGRKELAIELIRRAVTLRPQSAEAFANLGAALGAAGRFDEAIFACRQAIGLNPNLPEAHANLGSALRKEGRLEEAVAAFRQVLALQPNHADAHNNLGAVVGELGRVDEAIAEYRRAISLRPDIPEMHFNLALASLSRGDFARGWEEYEWRWKCADFAPLRRDFAQPLWDGNPLESRTILLHAEQGLGDTIQFIRYLPMVVERGGKVIIECQREVQRLLQTTYEMSQVIVKGQPLPAFDLHCPLMSLPRVFQTRLDTIPNAVPYLHANAEDARNWQKKLSGLSPGFKVGLVWGGSPGNENNHYRSIKLTSLAPLAQTPGVQFFSLQKGPAAQELKSPPSGMQIIDWTAHLNDFADTAALIANLDLVITIETAVAHLAGALGKPVWTLLPFYTDWRWLLDREDSPWYPTMGLFRQPSRGDWDSVVAKVAAALARCV